MLSVYTESKRRKKLHIYEVHSSLSFPALQFYYSTLFFLYLMTSFLARILYSNFSKLPLLWTATVLPHKVVQDGARVERGASGKVVNCSHVNCCAISKFIARIYAPKRAELIHGLVLDIYNVETYRNNLRRIRWNLRLIRGISTPSEGFIKI